MQCSRWQLGRYSPLFTALCALCSVSFGYPADKPRTDGARIGTTQQEGPLLATLLYDFGMYLRVGSDHIELTFPAYDVIVF